MLNKQLLYVYSAYKLYLIVGDRVGIKRTSKQQFYSVVFNSTNIVISMPQLIVVDPIISFAKGLLRFPPLNVQIKYNSLKVIIEERTKDKTLQVIQPLERVLEEELSIGAVETGPTQGRSGNEALPTQYRDFESIFDSTLTRQLTLSDPSLDYTIEVTNAPPHLLIYNLSQTKLQVLRKYLDGAL